MRLAHDQLYLGMTLLDSRASMDMRRAVGLPDVKGVSELRKILNRPEPRTKRVQVVRGAEELELKLTGASKPK